MRFESDGADGIILVVRTRMHWKHLPRTEVGCSGKARWRRLDEWQPTGVWAAPHRVILKQLPNGDALDWSRRPRLRQPAREEKGAQRRCL